MRYCGRIKNNDGNWIPLQEYVVNHSEAMLSYGICLDCLKKFKNNNSTIKRIAAKIAFLNKPRYLQKEIHWIFYYAVYAYAFRECTSQFIMQSKRI